MNTNENTVTNTNTKTVKTKAPRSVGRPAFKLKWPAGVFTIGQAYELNKATVKWPLTIRQRVDKELASGFLVKLDTTVKTGKVGKPAFKYLRASVQRSILARKAKLSGGTPTVTPTVETPVVETVTPVVAETPTVETPVVPAVVAETPVAVETVVTEVPATV